MGTPVLSIVTGHWNRHDAMRRLVDSLVANTTVDWELVVADVSDSLFETADQRVRVIDDRPKTTMTRGYNRAFRACRGEWVVWVNDDMTVEPNWANAGIEFMSAHPEIGMGALYYSVGLMDKFQEMICGRQVIKWGPFHVNMYHGTVFANCGILRRSLGDEVGWFDDDIAMYGNDNSLTFRVLLKGLGVVGIPGARLRHHFTEDEQRKTNELSQDDSSVIQRVYLPHIEEMKTTYLRTAHLQGPLEIPFEESR